MTVLWAAVAGFFTGIMVMLVFVAWLVRVIIRRADHALVPPDDARKPISGSVPATARLTPEIAERLPSWARP